LIWAGATGYRNVTKQKPAEIDTKYRIGSISKPLTATALAVLYSQEKIALDQPIKKYLPTLTTQHQDITLRQLASHTSGIRHYGYRLTAPYKEFWLNEKFTTVQASLELFINDNLSFEPGSEFQYSSFGYTLISAVMESATNTDFTSLMNKLVITPLAMSHTEVESTSDEQQNIATNYAMQFMTGVLKPAISIDSSYKLAAGGYIGTPSDLVKLGNFWLSDKESDNELISNNTRQQFLTVQRLINGDKNSDFYALGWRVQKIKLPNSTAKTTVIFHDGQIQGGTSFLVLFPEHEVVIAMVTNSNVENEMDLPKKSFQLAQLFLPKSITIKK